MDANHQDKKFVCKYCNKKFQCGKSLGGHIRIHLSGNSATIAPAAEEAELKMSKNLPVSNGSNCKRDSGSENGGPTGYGLRANPKKTKRFLIDSNNPNSLKERLCKECGKGFFSMKALCGHMACHSKNNLEDHSGATDKTKQVAMDSESDTEDSLPLSDLRNSRRVRYKNIGAYSSSFSSAYGSLSSGSDYEPDQEEVAMCLMMLSRDTGFKGCTSLSPVAANSSDNNSVAKSPATKMKTFKKNGANSVCNCDKLLSMNSGKQLVANSVYNYDSDNSDSGYFENGPLKIESDVSSHKLTRNDKLKRKVESQFDEDFDDAELGRRLSRVRCIRTGKALVIDDGCDRAERAAMKFHSRNLGKYSSVGSKKRTNVGSDSICVSEENSMDADYVPSPPSSGSKRIGKAPMEQRMSSADKNSPKKVKTHKCPFCPKVFKNGQALGGHKRFHFIGGSAENRTLVIKQEVLPQQSETETPISGLIDLNLLPQEVENANGLAPA